LKNKIIHGDCLEALKDFEDNTFDSIITDPPYGISFMGKKWDYDVPSLEIWQECLRVLKPGGIALVFAGTRTQHRMTVNIEDAGFEIRDCLMWLYGQGFPKGLNISKGIDKALGVKRERIKNPLAKKQTGQKNTNSLNDKNANLYVTLPFSEQAQKWDGYNTNLKPSYEPIIMAMKPLDKNFVNNALAWGVAGLNIDECRIETKVLDSEKRTSNTGTSNNINFGTTKNRKPKFNGERHNPKGRYPANVILDEYAAAELDEQSGILKSGAKKPHKQKKRQYNCYGKQPEYRDYTCEASQGFASRFFYVAKASPKERNMGCENLDNEKFGAGNYSQSPICKDCGKTLNGTNDHNECSGEVYYKEDMENKKIGNNHPTCKPLKLMEYLCKLTKPPGGGIVLDPFAGSGTTGLACQNTGRDFILIEREQEYIDIIKARMKANAENKQELLFEAI
jgi:site-specific DNA-methyltransferase (adenine-specific)